MRRSTFISIALMSAAVTWMFVDAIPGLAGRVMAEQTDRGYPEPEIDNVTRLRADLQTICDFSWYLWRMLDQAYDVDNHCMANEREMPFSGAGRCMESLQALQGEKL